MKLLTDTLHLVTLLLLLFDLLTQLQNRGVKYSCTQVVFTGELRGWNWGGGVFTIL